MFIQLKKEYFSMPPGRRVDVDEAQAKFLIEQGIAEALQDDPLSPLLAKTMEAAMGRLSEGINAAINGALRQVADAQAHSRRNLVPALFGSTPIGDRDPRHNFGDFCLCIATKNHKRLEEEYGSFMVDNSGVRMKAPMSEQSGSTGGYTVPPDFYQQLLAVIAENTFIRPRAWVQPMASATLQFPYLDVTTVQSAGVSPFFGGVQMYWTEEAQTRTETEPAFKMMELKAHELSGYSVSSNVLLADAAFGLEKFLFTLFGQAIAWFEEYAFIAGNGVGKPIGMAVCPAAISTGGAAGATGRQNANQIVYADVATMWSKLLPASWQKAIWCFSPTCVPQLLQLKDGANRAIFVSIDQGATKSPNWNLLGRPAIPTEKNPAMGTKGDLILIDPSLYVIGDRMQIEVAASEHVNFLKNQMTWRVVERVDGQPWLEKAITLQDATSQVSPFVVLN
jgi:HK97 family phage major capsid protein